MDQKIKNNYKFLDYIQRFFEVLEYAIVAYAVFYVIRQAIERANAAQDQNAKIAAYSTGAVLVVAIILFFAVINFSLSWSEKLNVNLQNTLYIFPRWRRAIIVPIVSLSPYLIYWATSNMETEIAWRILIGFYFLVVVNAALISLIRDDRAKEYSPLSSYITRDVFLQDRQAAIAKAFIVVEDHLARKVGPTESFSRGLINEAFGDGKTKGKLKLIIDGKDKTSDFRNFFIGAYGLLRNPRHHTLIEDDIYASASIFAVAELLFQYVNESETITEEQ